VDKTREYMETHYYKETKTEVETDHLKINRLFSDYATYLLDVEGKEKADHPFLSDSFIDASFRYAPYLFALVELPLNSRK